MRLLMRDLTRTGAVVELLIGPSRTGLFVTVYYALVRFHRHWTEQFAFDAVDGRLGLALHTRVERVGLGL